jgi:hypothetical protein
MSGSPYIKDEYRRLIQHRVRDGKWIVWNWETCRWDDFKEPIDAAAVSQAQSKTP